MDCRSTVMSWRRLSTRELSYSTQRRIAAFLDAPSILNWKDLLSQMPEYGPLQMQQLSNEQVRGNSPTLALLQHMSSSGRCIGDLYDYCQQLGMKRVCELILQGLKDRGVFIDTSNAPALSQEQFSLGHRDTSNLRKPQAGDKSPIAHDSDTKKDSVSTVVPSAPPFILYVSYDEILKATGHFDEKLFEDGGHKLGQGGFGEVFYCQIVIADRRREVAVKVFAYQDDPEMYSQFQTELNTITRLNHPHLLPLLGYSSNETSLCLLYPYMPLGSLDKHLQNIAISGQQRITIIKDIVSALHYLHTGCADVFVHRDLKSANVLLDQNWRGILTDFGIARTLNYGCSVDATQRIVGTRIYMAPEYCAGLVSPAADTYSLGIVMIEMLFGWLAGAGPPGSNTDVLSFLDDYEQSTDQLYLTCWTKEDASRVEKIAEKCIDNDRNLRPTTAEVLQIL